jgi:hypothetical protein
VLPNLESTPAFNAVQLLLHELVLLESCIFSALIHVHGWVFYLERHLLVVQLTCALLLVSGRRITSWNPRTTRSTSRCLVLLNMERARVELMQKLP